MPIVGAEARWRLPGGSIPDPEREIALTGRRVLAEGGSIIAAVDETLRFATKQAGYHGGASAAEAVIPIIVLSRNPDQLAATGWVPAPPQVPAWWNDEIASAAPATTPSAPSSTKKAKDTGPTLFDVEEGAPEVVAAPYATFVEEVMASPIYAAQKARYGARAASDDLVRAALTVLLRQSGRAHRDTVAAAAGIPAMSISGAIVNLRRQLNVEGYDVMVTDADEVTVILNVDLLRQQFLEGLG